MKKAADVFWQWDNFHYDETVPLLQDIADQAELLLEDGEFKGIADTVLRLKRTAGKMKLAVDNLRRLENSAAFPFNQAAVEGWLAILGDTIANARRRSNTDPVDCVLRCYRAIEMATQIGVFRLGINPWRPDWQKLDKAKLGDYLAKIRAQEPPRLISLDNGIRLIETLTSPLTEAKGKDIREIMSARNLSYLEHGYSKATQATARHLLARTEELSANLLSKVDIGEDPRNIAFDLRLET